ncbi:hypothetical protein [Halapricum desulfuricans]|nr:hypothetical protein [Halapricum desulfuricans]
MVDFTRPGTSPHNARTLEATLARSLLQLREAVPRGTGFHIVATV